MTTIGTIRPEEAKVYDSHEGYHQFHTEETQIPYGSFEVLWREAVIDDDIEKDINEAGWYWWPCYPGCLPDGEPTGPFTSSQQAHEDADECAPEYDDQ